jgi:hypothetical protein
VLFESEGMETEGDNLAVGSLKGSVERGSYCNIAGCVVLISMIGLF